MKDTVIDIDKHFQFMKKKLAIEMYEKSNYRVFIYR